MARDNEAKQRQQQEQQSSFITTNPHETTSPRTLASQDCSQDNDPSTTINNSNSNENPNPYDTAFDPYSTNLAPEPFRNKNSISQGASILGPRNRDRERQDPDMIRPPSTDAGHIPNMKWSFADSHLRIEVASFPVRHIVGWGADSVCVQQGGWARETTVRELPTRLVLSINQLLHRYMYPEGISILIYLCTYVLYF